MPSSDQHAVIWERRQAELWDRIFQVTHDVVTVAETIKDSVGGSHVKQELVASAMAVGKQLVRATAADDHTEFQHYLHEARMQAIETDYWLRLLYTLQGEGGQRDVSSIISQYAAVVDLLQKMLRHARGEKDVVSRHIHGPKVSL